MSLVFQKLKVRVIKIFGQVDIIIDKYTSLYQSINNFITRNSRTRTLLYQFVNPKL